MPAIRRRRIYSNDAHHPQENLSGYLRIAQINTVNVEAGSCTIHWLDSGGGRVDVALSQGSWGEYCMPIPGAIVLVMCDIHDQSKIVRYANLNQFFDQKSISDGGMNLVQKLQAGDKFWHSSGNAYLYLNSVGRVVLADSEGDMLEIDADANLFKVTSVNWKIVTNAGAEYFGDVKRWGTDGTYQAISDSENQLEERMIVVNDFNPDNKPTGVTTIKVNLGTYVTDNGQVVDKLGIPTSASSSTALAVRLEVNAPGGVTMVTIDKQGQIQVVADTIVLNSSKILLGGENLTEKGVLGNTLTTILKALIQKFNSHTHTPPGGSILPVFEDSDDVDTIQSTTVKLQ